MERLLTATNGCAAADRNGRMRRLLTATDGCGGC
jgi:hypothetical protein